jgi:hypothetical protein
MTSMRMIVGAAALALVAGGCTNDGYGPYYGPSQGYAYPSAYGYPANYGYYSPRPAYPPSPYGYGPGYAGYNSGPSITFTFPQGTVP